MSNDLDPQRLRRWEIIGFLAIVALVSWDLAVDYAEGVSWGHIAAELVILIIAASGAFVIWRQLKRARRRLVVVQSEANQWQEENRELLQGFSAAIATQFGRWELTPAESDIGFLLLKGLSHKEIAQLRSTSERTVREQSRSVYRKSALQGRAALSAFFLENIMLPDDA
jgi:DNA-binding CsgD family transcriptional regulator